MKFFLGLVAILACALCAACDNKPTPDPLLQDGPKGPVRSLHVGIGTNNLYAGTANGLFVFSGTWTLDEGTKEFGKINDIYEAPNGTLYVGADALNSPDYSGGLWRKENGQWHQDLTDTVFSFYHGEDRLVAATFNGAWELKPDGWKQLYDLPNTTGKEEAIHAFASLEDYDCLGRIERGIRCLNRTTGQEYILDSTSSNLGSDNVRAMTVGYDRRTIWIGMDGAPVQTLQIINGKPTILDIGGISQPELPKRVLSIRFNIGEPWIATLDNGAYYFGSTSWKHEGDSEPANAVAFYQGSVIIGFEATQTEYGVRKYTP